MLQYLVKRLLLMVPTLFGITLVTFLLIRLAPGDPLAFKLGGEAGGSLEAGGGGESGLQREHQILRAKVRLGLMEERGTLRFWDAERGSGRRETAAHGGAVLAVAWSPDGARLAAAAADRTISLWEAASARRLAVLSRHEGGVNALAWSPDGARLASAGDDKVVRLWDLAAPGGAPREAAALRGHAEVVRAVAWSPLGDLIASGSRDRSVILWDAATGREVGRLRRHYLDVQALAFSPDGRYLASGSLDRTVLIWDVAARALVRELTDAGAAVRALAYAREGGLLAAGLSSNLIVLWMTDTYALRGRLAGHAGRVNAVAWSPDGGRLASASLDKSVRFWDIGTMQESGVLAGHGAEVEALAWSSRGEIASAALDIGPVPLLAAYADWFWRLVRLDLGRSFKDGRPVRDRILEALPITLVLNLTSIFLIYLISIPVGVVAAARRDGLFDHVSSFFLFALYSLPSFWVATMLILLFSSPRGFSATHLDFMLPATGLHDDAARLWPYLRYLRDYWLHLLLPLTAITYNGFAFLSRLVRSSMLEVLGMDFVRTARAKGLPEARVVGVHAFRNSLISVVTHFGNLLPHLIGGSVIIEYIFSIPGMGMLAFDAILQRDYPVIMGVTTLAAVLTLAGILLSDILYCIVDPRIELQ